ncbi:MAG TPA: DUF4232 domain-containing protein [Nocardioidaceae bacterium]|nr:DUF4232 domain-containing protein [Nocardioidaceae bacterium]
MSSTRSRRTAQVSALAAIALLTSACTGSTPGARHQAGPDSGPSSVQSTASSPAPAPATSAAATPSPSPSPSTAAAADPCGTEVLTVSLKPGGVAAGSTYQRLVFTNTGNADCSLTGFPGVSYVTGRDGSQVGAAAERMGSSRTVSLSPGGSAVAVVQSSDARNYPEDQCRQTPAAGMRVYPPNQTASVFVRDRALACADPSVRVLHVGSVRAG